MDVPAPESQGKPAGLYTVERYLRLADEGVLGPEDRVELLEGVIVAMSPSNTPHDAGVMRASHALWLAVAGRAVVRVQLSLVVGRRSVPEPDVAVVPGLVSDYDRRRPTSALLAVEVADSSIKQDRLTKGPIYAAADVPEYWIVNIRDQQVEVHRSPDPESRRYRVVVIARRGERLELAALPGATVAVDDLLPVLDD
jgi:Uma2 family endonuclease